MYLWKEVSEFINLKISESRNVRNFNDKFNEKSFYLNLTYVNLKVRIRKKILI